MSLHTPSWTGDSKRFVPGHLNAGTTRSSFESNENSGDTSMLRDTSFQRSSFRRTSSTAGSSFGAPKVLRRSADADLPPSESIYGSLPSMSKDGDSLDAGTTATGSVSVSVSSDRPVLGLSMAGDSAPDTTAANATAILEDKEDDEPTAVLVFGFPPGMTATVVNHFAKFGEILEQRSFTGSTPPRRAANRASRISNRLAAVECGRNWLQIHYRSRSAAARAIEENGHMLSGGFVVGCVLADDGDTSADVSLAQDASLGAPVSWLHTDKKPAATPGPRIEKLTVEKASVFKDEDGFLHGDHSMHLPAELRKDLSWLGWFLRKMRDAFFGWDV